MNNLRNYSTRFRFRFAFVMVLACMGMFAFSPASAVPDKATYLDDAVVASYRYEVFPSSWRCGTQEPAANIVQARFEPDDATNKIRVYVAKCNGGSFTSNGTIRIVMDDSAQFKNWRYRTSTSSYRCGGIIEFRLVPRSSDLALRGTAQKCDDSDFNSDGDMYISSDGNIIAGPDPYSAGNSSESITFTPLELNSAGRHTYRAYFQSDNNAPGDYIISGAVDAWEEYHSYLSGSWQVQAGQSETSFLFDPMALGVTSGWHKYQVHVYPSGQNYPIRSGIISARDVPLPQGDQYEPDDVFTQSTSIGTNGNGQTHTIHVAGNDDWMKFQARSGYEYTIETYNLQGGADTVLGLFWDDQNDGHPDLIVRDDSSGTSRVVWIADQTTTRWIKVRDRNDSLGGANVKYSVKVTEGAPQGDPYEPDGHFSQAKSIEVNTSGQTHTIHLPNDDDWMKFEARSGFRYVIETFELQGGADTVLGLFWDEQNDGHADLIVKDESPGTSHIEWTADKTATRWIKVRDQDTALSGANVKYSVKVTEGTSGLVQHQYTSFGGGVMNLYVYEGENIALLVPSSHLQRSVLDRLISTIDSAYEYYKEATGREPTPHFIYNNKTTIAVVPSTCGAGCGFLGFTGVELLESTFDLLYSGVRDSDQYEQTVFYELGRNFWFYGDELEYKGTDDTGAVTTGFAVFMRFMSMDAAGVTGAPFNGNDFSYFKSEVVGLLDTYLNDHLLTWENTLKIGEAPANNLNLGATDLFASFMFALRARYGDELINTIWREAERRSAARTTSDAVDNFVISASSIVGENLSNLFRNTWRWPVSTNAEAEIQRMLDPYEPDQDFTQASRINANEGARTHSVHRPGDADWLEFDAQTGHHYVIETTNLQGGVNTFIGLFWDEHNDNHPDLISTDDDGGNGVASRIEWTAQRNAPHYVKVRDVDPTLGNANATYDVRITSISDPSHKIYLPLIIR